MHGHFREQPNSRHGFIRRSGWGTLNAIVMLALAACGGGGGDDPPPAPPVQNPPANTAPTAQAGADQTIQLPATAQLTGSGTDAENNTLTYAWTSAPATVTFSSTTTAATTATFPGAGTYTLTLTVNDGTATATDTVVVTVQTAPTANAPPTVNAGPDQTIVRPATTAQLTGTATDDNPSSTLTYTWSTSAAGASMATPNAAATSVTLPAAVGSYDFVLSVSDGTASASDTVTVRVDHPPLVFPGPDGIEDPASPHGWTEVAPADQGMDVAFLNRARDYSLVGGTGGTDQGGSGLITRGGRMVYRWGDIDIRYQLKSATKSVGGIALGLALADNLVTLDAKAQTLLPSIGLPANTGNAQLANITLLQLATHTAGFEKPGVDPLLTAAPGTRWRYSDGSLNWLADVLTQAYASDLNTLLNTRIWQVLNIGTDDLTWRVRTDPHPGGFPRREFASGMVMNTNAMARVGLLFLAGGNWNGTQVFPSTFVDLVKTPRPETALATNADPVGFPNATTKHGVLWWTNAAGELPAPVPKDTYWAWGLGDSLIVVIPSLQLVIARVGNDPDNAGGPELPQWRFDWDGRYDVLVDFIKPIVCSTSPTDPACL